MAQKFFQGRTNNHLNWVMVDSTDFTTPESAMSAATKIKIYGELAGGTGVNFVTSGTGSLTNDITHVGASALGIYQIALAKADLSDASAAWYDTYVISLSATGAAYQTLIVEGVLTTASTSGLSAIISDIYSLLSDTRSTMDSQFLVVSNYLSQLSAIASDIDSALSSQFVASSSIDSDILSAVRGNSDYLSKMSDILSNAYSAAVVASSRAGQAASRALLNQSTVSNIFEIISDVDSALSSQFLVVSNYLSNISAMVSDVDSALSSQFVVVSSFESDILSAVRGNSDYLSKMSDVLSNAYSAAVVASSRAGLAASRALLNQSTVSNIFELISDVDSALTSQFLVTSNYLSNISDTASNAYSAAVVGASRAGLAASRALLIQSTLSTVYELASDIDSALTSQFVATSSIHSDILSAVNAVAVSITASDISDIADAVASAVGSVAAQTNSRVLLIQSSVSNIYELVSDVDSALSSQFLVTSNYLSNISAMVSDVDSALSSQFVHNSAIQSDILSAVRGNSDYLSKMSDVLSNAYSAATVAASRAGQAASRALLIQSTASNIFELVSDVDSALTSQFVATSSIHSDIYSLLSDVSSDLGVLSGVISDIQSGVTAAGIKKNTALSAFEFYMVLASDHATAATGLTVTATRSIDGGAFASATNAPTEVSNGIYAIDLSAGDLNGTVITLKFAAATADTRVITIKTNP